MSADGQMTTSPFFSIVIPMYNRRAEIGRALNSCLAQTLKDFEVVVVDDRSTDDSAESVRAYSDPRIRLTLHEANRGACAARNIVWGMARVSRQ
jgi:glycosyltransferase involved in cell wall biosynthesis